MTSNHQHMVVVAALIERDGKLLVNQRPPGGWGAGKWEFPGGKVDPDEDPRDALARECREELGVEVSVGRAYDVLSHRYEYGAVILLFFQTRILAGEPRQLEGGQIEWAGPETLLDYDWLPADRPLVEEWVKERSAP